MERELTDEKSKEHNIYNCVGKNGKIVLEFPDLDTNNGINGISGWLITTKEKRKIWVKRTFDCTAMKDILTIEFD